ncbi:MAG: hypothetical protein BMS9Abin13_215 [Patescibacteria group bacterium]|nr:MAG: hypothetical protein BMS9Abin13_215 [Patescibacteria group bacterium]
MFFQKKHRKMVKTIWAIMGVLIIISMVVLFSAPALF